MKEFTFALISEGSSDIVLVPILNWLLKQYLLHSPIRGNWVDFRVFRNPPRTLSEKIRLALSLYEPDLLFIHRDSDNQPAEIRITEIQKALEALQIPGVCVVPVQMQEAWLLIDEQAIRLAVGNKNGRVNLSLPPLPKLEQVLNPKAELHGLLKRASELSGRHLDRLNVRACAVRVVEFIDDYSALRQLQAFQRLETDLYVFLQETGWLTEL